MNTDTPSTPLEGLKLNTLVLSDSREVADYLVSLLSETEGITPRSAQVAYGEGPRAMSRFEPDVVVLAEPLDTPAQAVEILDSASPGTPILAILPEGDLAGVQECNLAGAAGTLVQPFDRESLTLAVRQVYTRELRRRQHLASLLDGGAARMQRPRVIAVHGAKGGVGATMLACNLAAALRRLTERRVAFVDCDVLGGDAGVTFDLPPTRSLADVIPVLRDLEADLVDRLFAEHESGVRVLFAPEQLQRAEGIDGDDAQRTLASLRPYFDFQIVDVASQMTPVTLATLDEADLIVHVVTPEVPALRDSARFLRLADQLGYAEEKVMVVLNRADAGKGISSAVVEEQLRRPIAASVPSDGRTVIEATNGGELLVLSQPRNKVARAIEQLAEEVATAFGWNEAKRPRLRLVTPATEDTGETNEPARRWWPFPVPGRKPESVTAAAQGSLAKEAA